MLRIRTCVVLVVLTNALLAAAETLTLDEALNLADRAHPSLQAGAAQIDVAQAGITTARAYPNPETGVMAGRQTAGLPGNYAGKSFFYYFSQPLELGKLRPSRIEFAQRGRDSSLIALTEIRLGVLSRVRHSFYQVLRRKSQIQLAEERMKMVQDLHRRIQVRVEVGEAGRLELLRAEAEAATARTLANSAQLELITALSQFRAAVASPLPSDLDLQGALDATPPPLSLEDLRQEVLDRNPTLALAQSEVSRADANLNYQVAQRRPQPALRTEADYQPGNPSYRAGIGIPLPFWNRFQGPIAEAAASIRVADRLARAQQIELLSALEGAYGRYRVAGQQILAYEQGVLREASQALDAAETAYQLGERGILEVLDAQRVLYGVRFDYMTAQYERQDALLEIDQLRAIDLRRAVP